MQETSTLQLLGLSAEEEAVYRLVLQRPGESTAHLAGALAISHGTLRSITGSLEEKGLISRTAGRSPRFMGAPPELALELLLHQRQEEIDRARIAAHQLSEELRASAAVTGAGEVVEVLKGREAINRRVRQLVRSAVSEILAFDKPPYEDPNSQNLEELDALARGVIVRVIYDRESLEVPDQMKYMKEIVEAGERARVTANVPMKIEIFDRKVGMVPLNIGEPGHEGALMIHHSPLLEALITLFEALWAGGVPVALGEAAQDVPVNPRDMEGRARDTRPSKNELALLTMLASGLKDDAIAHQLSISPRTVKRRVRGMMNRLGADTRFQAGLQAALHGWLNPESAGSTIR